MKIEQGRKVISFENAKVSKKASADVKSAKTEVSTAKDSSDSRLSNALNSAVEGIRNSGLSAGQIHSKVDEKHASGLLKSTEVDSTRPRLSETELLKLADQVVKASAQDPAKAAAAFKEIDANRVADLV